jgi:hypothetical protein
MRDRSAPPGAALSGARSTEEPADSRYLEVHTVYHYHGTVINIEERNVNYGDNYGERLFI